MKTTKATNPRNPTLSANQYLQVVLAEMEKESHGPEGEKWVMPNEPASLMAETSVEHVAMVAANLSRSDLPAHECVIKAYEIIRWAAIGHGFLMGNPHPRINRWSALLSDYIRREECGETCDEEVDPALVHVKWDEKNGPLPLAYADALAAIDPKQDRTSRREPRIIEWMVAVGRAKSPQEAQKILDEWNSKNEVPFVDFNHAFYSFRVWMRMKTSFQNAKKKESPLTEKQIAALENAAKSYGKDTDAPKKKKKIKPTDGRKKPKHSGIVGKGRGYDEEVHKIPKKTLE
jgi:hypothetical protein